MTVTPRSTMALICDQKSRRVRGSTPEVGSSRKRTGGSCMIAQARARRCLKPRGSKPAVELELIAEVEAGDCSFDRLAAVLTVEAVDRSEEVQVLAHAQVAVERELLRHVAEPCAGGAGGAVEVEAGDAGQAGRGPRAARTSS